MADGEGFEPSVAFTTTVFKTAPKNRSGTRPLSIVLDQGLNDPLKLNSLANFLETEVKLLIYLDFRS